METRSSLDGLGQVLPEGVAYTLLGEGGGGQVTAAFLIVFAAQWSRDPPTVLGVEDLTVPQFGGPCLEEQLKILAGRREMTGGTLFAVPIHARADV